MLLIGKFKARNFANSCLHDSLLFRVELHLLTTKLLEQRAEAGAILVKSGYSLCHVLGFKSQPIVLQLRDDLHVHVFLLVHLLHVLIIVNDTVVPVVTCIRILL